MLHQFGLGCIKNGALWPIRNGPYVPFRNGRIRYPAWRNASTKFSPMAERPGDHVGVESVNVLHLLMSPRQALRQLVWLSAPWISTPEYPTPVQLLLQGEGSQSHKGWRIWLKKGQGRHREQKGSACMMLIDCVHGELGNSSRQT